MTNIKIRCSKLGDIMTNPRSKGEILSQTAKNYLHELYLENNYGIKKDFWSRYTDKGIQCEKDGIALANEVLGWGLPFHYIEQGGQETFENEYVTGRTDICTNGLLADIKCSYDANTFPWFTDDIPNIYFYQLQGYMWLSGIEVSELVFCLVNTPELMVLDEIRRENWKQNAIDEDPDIEEYVRAKHNFDHIPKEDRVRRFLIEKDEDVIQRIKERIELCREYYNGLKIGK
jgi:hypothetical protein